MFRAGWLKDAIDKAARESEKTPKWAKDLFYAREGLTPPDKEGKDLNRQDPPR
jgi:hypothetical protein